jgi:glycosyltransferase involved in cell wall biosynthesis
MPSVFATLYRSFRHTPILLLIESDPLRGNANRLGWFKRRLRRFVANRVDWVLTNNAAGRRYVLENLPIPPQRILCRPYVVSEVTADEPHVDDVSPREQLGDQDKLVFLYVGQLIERKGILQLIEAVANLDHSEWDKCRFWIVGDGQHRSTIEQQIRRRGLARIIRLLGRQPYEKLGAFYRSADVFVMPTLDDYRALAGFEALAHGMPLLQSCYDGAANEIAHEGRNGCIVDPHDTTSLVNGIRWFVEREDKLSSYGEYSYSLSRQFTVDVAVQSLAEATRRCLLLSNAWTS